MSYRTVLAVILSIAVMIVWSLYMNKPESPGTGVRPSGIGTSEQATKSSEPQKEQTVDTKTSTPAKETPTVVRKQPRPSVIKGQEYKVETDECVFTLTSAGGRIKSVLLKKFQKSSINKDTVELIEAPEDNVIFPLGLEIDSNDALDYVNYRIEKIDDLNYKLTYLTKGNEGGISPGISITKNLKFSKDKYIVELSLILENLDKSAKQVSIDVEPFVGPANKKDIYNNITLSYFLDGKYKSVGGVGAGCSMSQNSLYPLVSILGNIDWIAMANRYFMFSIVAKDKYKVRGITYNHPEENLYICGIVNKTEPKQINKYDFLIYAGPKKRDLFREYTKQYPELWSLEKTIGFQKLISPIGNLLLDVLIFLNKVTKNYGISIIVITVLIKILFHPLTHKQYESMAKMQKLQPAINNLKQQYKENQQKMNQEIMLLYRKNKVNPLGGCFPMLLQIPVFFGFYDMLMKSFELRNASFLWVKDLAAPDTVGMLAGIPINVLPIFMFVSTLIQQKMTPVADKRSAQLMYIMPFIFLFIFWNLPSGLVLYWTVQNILTIFQQMMINKPQEKTEKTVEKTI